MRRPLNVIRRCGVVLTGMVLLSLAAGGALSAPIVGSEPGDTGSVTGRAPGLPALVPGGTIDPNSTVLDVSVGTEKGDPNQPVVTVTVHQTGGRRVCVDVRSTDLITRAYRPVGDEPFVIDSVLTGDISGDSADLKGFNKDWVFLRPHSANDNFPVATECFKFDVGDAEGCFVPSDDDCPQELGQGDYLCVGEFVSTTECDLGDHVNALRLLRILLALNQPVDLTAIAPGAGAQPTAGLIGPTGTGGPGQRLPAGRLGPILAVGFSGGGGGLISVPNVVGLSLAAAQSLLAAAGLVVASVQPAAAGGQFVVAQSPIGGTLVEPQTGVSLVLELGDIPEPATFGLFAVGLLLLVLLVRLKRPKT